MGADVPIYSEARYVELYYTNHSFGDLAAQLDSTQATFDATHSISGDLAVQLDSTQASFAADHGVAGDIGAVFYSEARYAELYYTIQTVRLDSTQATFSGETYPEVAGYLASTLGETTAAFAATHGISGDLAAQLGSTQATFSGETYPEVAGDLAPTLGETTAAFTGLIAPAPPTNLRQFEERIIAVICRWDHPNPVNVHDTEVQLLYGSEMVLADALVGAATERTFVVPMASTDYLLRVRAGNAGGWSAWAEATVSSETFPLIDSRLGVLGATYQEDVLHTDTWDGASDQFKGVVEAIQAEAGVSVGGFALTETSPLQHEISCEGLGALDQSHSLNVQFRLMRKNQLALDLAAFDQSHTCEINFALVRYQTYALDIAAFDQSPSLSVNMEIPV